MTMPGKPNPKRGSETLRARAEKLSAKPDQEIADTDASRLLHEIEVHQIELEMQNTELRDARDEAEELLEKYTELYDFAPVGYFTMDADGVIKLVNLTGSTIVGVGRANLIGRSFAMLIAPAQRAAFRSFLKEVFARDAKQSGEFDLADQNLATRNINIEARRSPDGLECSAMILDITARKQARVAMQISEIRHRRLFETAQDGILLIDPATALILDANPFVCKLLGMHRDQLIGTDFSKIGLLKGDAACQKMFRELKKNLEVRHADLLLETGSARHVELVAHPYEESGRPMIQCNIRDITARKVAEELSQRNIKLEQEITRREKVEEDLRANRKEQDRLLQQSRSQQIQLRELSHRILNAQEDERKRISRELHDVIAQSLVSINIYLAVLNHGSSLSPATFRRQLSKTQNLVKKAVEIVHDFARELRPTMLDDLGLLPALQFFMEQFMSETGIHVTLKASAKIQPLDTMGRTVLYRIAQEALTNVARHAKATQAEVSIESVEKFIRMTIKDNGQGFQVIGKSGSRKKTRLGLVGMKERAEMMGGSFEIDSSLGGPTTVRVEIPAGKSQKIPRKKSTQ